MKEHKEKTPIADRGYVCAVAAGFAAALFLPLLCAALIGRDGPFGEIYDKYGAVLGAAFVALFLLFRFIARTAVKKKKGDPAYFRGKMTIFRYEKSLAVGMILFSSVTAAILILISENVFWAIVLGFPGLFLPFSRFLLADEPMQQNDAGVIRADKKE